MIGTSGFTNVLDLEEGLKYASKRPGGCAYCFKDDHDYLACPCSLGVKRAHARANPAPPPTYTKTTIPVTHNARHTDLIDETGEPNIV